MIYRGFFRASKAPEEAFLAVSTLLHKEWMYIFHTLFQALAGAMPTQDPSAALSRYRPNGETGRRMGLKIPRS